MNLVQKLSTGLGLACLIFLSSCSKEDELSPQPKIEGVNANSNLKVDESKLFNVKSPYLASTYGQTGFDIYPMDWKRDPITSNNLLGIPTGTSSLTHLFGNAGYPWMKPLPKPIDTAHEISILTFTSHAKLNVFDYISNAGIRSTVSTTIKNLIPGKIYKLTYYGASTICKVPQNGYAQAYATAIFATVDGTPAYFANTLSNDPAAWVPTFVIFKAVGFEATLRFTAYSPSDEEFTYAHVFVDKNSIKAQPDPEPMPF
jgi:hypothetical protein